MQQAWQGASDAGDIRSCGFRDLGGGESFSAGEGCEDEIVEVPGAVSFFLDLGRFGHFVMEWVVATEVEGSVGEVASSGALEGDEAVMGGA